MYAIRSYYAEHLIDLCEKLFREKIRALAAKRVDQVLEQDQVRHFITLDKTDHLCRRITSYNVCYTKLLRVVPDV